MTAKTATRPAAVLSQEEDASAKDRALQSSGALSLSPRILELLTLPCSLEELEEDYRVTSISDQLRIGFAISDRATQTDSTEIRELKEFTETTKMLFNFANTIYDDFAMYKTILKAQYEEKIQEHAFHLWQEINDRLQYVEEFYKQKETKMRHSFQQQLCDALAVLRTNYTKYFLIEDEKSGKDEETLAEKLDRLRIKTEEQAALIESLEEDLLSYKMKESKKFSQFDEEDYERELLQQENWEFKQQLTSLNEKFTRLQEIVKRKEKEQLELETEISKMNDKRERDMKTIEKLLNSQEILKLELDREKQRVLAKAQEVKEAKEAVQKLMESSAGSLQKLASPEGKKQAKKGKGGKKGKGETKQEREEREAREAAEKEAAAKEAAAKEAAEREAAPKGKYLGSTKDLETDILMLQNEIKRLKKSEEKARVQAQKLQHELHHSSQSWQMKFEILKKSLHAIKDEMFLRQSLRQTSKTRRPLHTDRTVPPLHLQTHTGRKDKIPTASSSLYVHYAPLPGINPQADAVAKEGTAKLPITIDIPGTTEGVSDGEEDLEEAAHVPSPSTPLP